MRIIAGQFRSRKLLAPPGLKTRPTSDRLRETLFNVLAPRIVGARFADLYAGSGAVGLEALSRGAEFVFFVERAKAALAALRANADSLGLKAGVDYRLETRDVREALNSMSKARARLDIVFLDPPYEAVSEYAAALEWLIASPLLEPDAVVVAEHARRQALPLRVKGLLRHRLLEQGDAALSFYSLAGE